MLVTKAITVRPPWSWAIATGVKNIENRGKPTSYRGPIAIHAARHWSKSGGSDPRILRAYGPYTASQGRAFVDPKQHPHLWRLGQIVAVAELVDCHEYAGCCAPWGDATYTGASETPRTAWHLVWENVRPVTEPIEVRGQLTVPWNLPEGIEL